MFYTKRYIFHYDTSAQAWSSHTKLLAHNNMECTAFLFEDDDINDLINIEFDDGFEAMAFMYELEVVK